jgi:hypothetical protein
LRKKLAARLAEKQLAEMRNATVMVAFVGVACACAGFVSISSVANRGESTGRFLQGIPEAGLI